MSFHGCQSQISFHAYITCDQGFDCVQTTRHEPCGSRRGTGKVSPTSVYHGLFVLREKYEVVGRDLEERRRKKDMCVAGS